MMEKLRHGKVEKKMVFAGQNVIPHFREIRFDDFRVPR